MVPTNTIVVEDYKVYLHQRGGGVTPWNVTIRMSVYICKRAAGIQYKINSTM